MHDTTFNAMRDTGPTRTTGRRGFAAALAVLVLIGLGGAAWFGWHAGWLRMPGYATSTWLPAATAPDAPAATASASAAAIVAQGNLQGNLIATNAALAEATGRLAALQQRLAELNQQAMAAAGQATRAEGLLMAVAVRRGIERGQPLGYLEPALRASFGVNQPGAVDQVIAAGHRPMTIGMLNEEFALLEPRLTKGPANEGAWDWVTRQMSGLFILRHDDMPSPAPESRIARARAALAGQNIDLAIAEINRLPGKDAARDWIAHARDYLATQRALDQIESAALAIPAAAIMPQTAPPPTTSAVKPAAAPAESRSSPAPRP